MQPQKASRLTGGGRRLRWPAAAGVAELADALDSKSSIRNRVCGFESLLRHFLSKDLRQFAVKRLDADLPGSGKTRVCKVTGQNDLPTMANPHAGRHSHGAFSRLGQPQEHPGLFHDPAIPAGTHARTFVNHCRDPLNRILHRADFPV